jgi:ketosteroid isomerase-like protein
MTLVSAPGERPQADRTDAADPVALVQAAYRSFRDGDVEGLLSRLSPEVVWVHPIGMSRFGLGGSVQGHTGVRRFLAHVPTVIGGMRLQPEEYLTAGDRVVVLGVRHVTSRSGNTETLRFVHAWTFAEGLAVRLEDIFDTIEFARVVET